MIAHRKAALESDCCFDGTQRGLHTQAEGHASDGTAQCREMAHLCDKKASMEMISLRYLAGVRYLKPLYTSTGQGAHPRPAHDGCMY